MRKWIFVIMTLLLSFGLGARAANTVRITAGEGTPDSEVTVSIALGNTDAVSSMQLSIPLSSELMLVEGKEQLNINRCPNHSLQVGVKDGLLNIVIYSLSMTPITGNSGEVATFKLKLGNQPESIALSPSKTVLTNANGKTVESATEGGTVTIRCAKAQYDKMEVDFGRVPIRATYTNSVLVTNVGNADLVVIGVEFSDINVYSTTSVFPMTIAPGASKQLNIPYAPMKRGNVERTMKVVCNSISKLNTIRLESRPYAVNELHIQPASGISDEEVTISMTMNNMDPISGYQVEFQLPEALEFVKGSFELSDRKQDHVGTVSVNGSSLLLLAYSPTGKSLAGEDGLIGSFRAKLKGRYNVQLTPTKTVLSATINNVVENVVSDVFGTTVEIRSPQISTESFLNFGAVPVTQACEKVFAIRNYGSAPLIVNRIVFNNQYLSVKESVPLVIPSWGNSSVTVVFSSVEQSAFKSTMQIYSNDPELRLREVTVTGSRFAPNYMSVNTPDVYVDDTLAVNVELDTYDAVSGLQFDITYPSGYYEPFADNYKVTDRANGMTVTTQKLDMNTLRCVCFFLNGSNIAAGKGKVMSLLLKPIDSFAPEGNYIIGIKNIKMGTDGLVDKYAGSDSNCSFQVKNCIPATVTAKCYTRKYGEANPTFEFTVNGGDLVGTPEISCAATATSPVGTYDIVVKQGTVKNYNVTYVAGTLTITKAPLKITAGTYTKKQGDPIPEFTLTYEGFKNNETKDVLTKLPTVSCEASIGSTPGEYAVTVSGAEAQNYAISYTNGKLIVVAADAVIVKAKNYTREYGEANPTFEFTTEGAVLEGTPEIICEAKATSPVGNYDIIVKQGTVTNYNVTYVNGTLTIEKAPLTVSVGNYSREQGQDNPAFVLTYQGWKNGEDESVLLSKPVATTTATENSMLGDYPITISGGEAQNYKFEYVDGVLTVTASTFISRILASGKPFDVYALSGKKVRCQVTTLEGLPKGVYIINGRKVAIK